MGVLVKFINFESFVVRCAEDMMSSESVSPFVSYFSVQLIKQLYFAVAILGFGVSEAWNWHILFNKIYLS